MVEGTPLLRAQTSKGSRGFESLRLRHPPPLLVSRAAARRQPPVTAVLSDRHPVPLRHIPPLFPRIPALRAARSPAARKEVEFAQNREFFAIIRTKQAWIAESRRLFAR